MGNRKNSGRPDWPWVPQPGLPGVPSGQGLPGADGYRTEQLSEVLARRLMEQRVVLLHGPLEDATVTRVSAELMTLDAEGDEPVTLRIDCGEASLAPALTLMDVVELMGVPVRALCLGQVGGGAVGVLAVCAHRSAMPSTRFSLSEPTTHLEAHVRNVAQWAELRAAERQRFCDRVATAVGKAASEVGADLERGRFFGAPEAVAYGLLDEVCRPDAEIRSLRGSPGSGSGSSGPSGSSRSSRSSGPAPSATPTPMGFRPLR